MVAVSNAARCGGNRVNLHESVRYGPTDGGVLPLLAVTREDDGTLLLAFGGGTALRLHVEAVDATLEDLSGAWGALAVPRHGEA